MKQPQGLTQWPLKEGKLASFQCGGIKTNTWHQSPLLHRTASFLLTQCPLLWILEVSSEVSLRLVFVLLLLVSSVLEVCSSINKVFHEVSLSFGFSLLGFSVSTRSLVSFVMPKVHLWSLIVISFFFKVCVTRGVLCELVSGSKMSTMAHNGAGLMALNCLPMQLKLNSCGWWTTGGPLVVRRVWQNKNKL